MVQEIWYDIPNYEGYFQISNLLRVRYFYFYNYGKFHKLKEPKIKKVVTSSTYPQIRIGFAILGNIKTLYMHHIVAKVFIPNPCNYPVIRHKDDNKMNYSIDNLEWGTHADNIKDSFVRGRMPIKVGSNASAAKITEKIALEIFNIEGKGYELREKYGISYTTIYGIKKGLLWNHITGLPKIRKNKLNL